jgi:hypothetical protein
LVVASARVVVSEERRGKEREREREKLVLEKRSGGLFFFFFFSPEGERHEGVRISSVLLFPENESVCGYSFLFGT